MKKILKPLLMLGLIGFFTLMVNIIMVNASIFKFGNKAENDNSVYKNVETRDLGTIGVALSTNMGIKHTQFQNFEGTVYNDVMNIAYILSNKQVARDKLISRNMILLNEYLNVLKTDIKTMLNQNNDRADVLDAYISQLEFRYKKTVNELQNLLIQKENLVNSYNSTTKSIESLKGQIGVDFKNFDSTKTITNIDTFLDLKEQNTYAYTYVVFISKFVDYYNYLNNYNRVLIKTLKQNREIIIKNGYVVIPEEGIGLLKKLDVIETENDYVNQ